MPHDRQFYEPEGGLALDKDSNLFDVTQWRKDGTQARNGQDHQRVYDPEATDLLKQILTELKQLNTHLYTITELDVKSWD